MMDSSSGTETMFSLAGRTAIVTGAATGIGQAIAVRLASDASFAAEVRGAIRAGLAASPLTDMVAHTRHLEAAYETAVRDRFPVALTLLEHA